MVKGNLNSNSATDGIGMTSQRTRDRLIDRLKHSGISDTRVLEAMRRTPRHLFVDEALAHKAYDDVSLPIGQGQTISQPFVVARMCELGLSGTLVNKRVLEVGTGCGYQAAVLAELFPIVFSVERIKDLYLQAQHRLATLQLYHVHLRYGDGFSGWLNESPFDAILVAAAAPEIPEKLLRQLAVGGKLVIPVGDSSQQELQIVTRTDSDYSVETDSQVTFVPFLRGQI